jgi:predicted hotdog family 3-hydroxylacyl-ACP dehydratase
MLRGDGLCATLPHSGDMCLLDALVQWDEVSAVCTAVSHLDPANPLRRDGGLAAVHAIEYAGQAAALHGALFCTKGPSTPGSSPEGGAGCALLAAVNEVELGPVPLDRLAEPLRIAVWRELAAGQGAIYRFLVESAGETVARGRLVVAQVGAPWT